MFPSLAYPSERQPRFEGIATNSLASEGGRKPVGKTAPLRGDCDQSQSADKTGPPNPVGKTAPLRGDCDDTVTRWDCSSNSKLKIANPERHYFLQKFYHIKTYDCPGDIPKNSKGLFRSGIDVIYDRTENL